MDDLAIFKELLGSKKWEERLVGCCGLMNHHPELLPAFLQTLIELLNDENLLVRRAAIETLGKAGSAASPAVPALVKLLAREDWAGRELIILSLAKIRSREAIGPLCEIASDEKEGRRRTLAAKAIAAICSDD